MTDTPQIIANDIPPIEKTTVINRSQADVFDFFIHSIGKWWPMEESCDATGGKKITDIDFPTVIGDKIKVSYDDGSHMLIGQLIDFKAPHRLVFSWHWGWDENQASEVEVNFSTVENDSTQVKLTHYNWHLLGNTAEEMRNQHEGGWEFIIGDCFVNFCHK